MKTITVKGVECVIVGFRDDQAADAIARLVAQLRGGGALCGLCPEFGPSGCGLGGAWHCAAVEAVAQERKLGATSPLSWVCVPVQVYPLLKLLAAPGALDAATYKGEPS